MIRAEQCRAARALLGWSQDDLERHSKVAKKTIADFERSARSPRDQTNEVLQRTLEGSGVVFIPQNGGGAGARLRIAVPKLRRRADIYVREWVAFSFDYRGAARNGFVTYAALDGLGTGAQRPALAFDAERDRILVVAAEKFDRGELDEVGQVTPIEQGDLPPNAQETDE